MTTQTAITETEFVDMLLDSFFDVEQFRHLFGDWQLVDAESEYSYIARNAHSVQSLPRIEIWLSQQFTDKEGTLHELTFQLAGYIEE
jgi:hypothetical protein